MLILPHIVKIQKKDLTHFTKLSIDVDVHIPSNIHQYVPYQPHNEYPLLSILNGEGTN